MHMIDDTTRLKLTSYPLNGVRVISMSDCASQPSMMQAFGGG